MKKAIISLFAAVILFTPNLALARVPSDVGYVFQEKMWNLINAPSAWDYSTGTEIITVAIIDTGVDTNNFDLSDNIWKNLKEISNNQIDDDKNGYIDDINGWNFADNNNNVSPPADKNGEYSSAATHHGTLIAGLIGAVGDNGRAGAGVNWKAKIMVLKAVDNVGGGSFADVTKAVDYAIKMGASIISMSFVGDTNDYVLREKLLEAYKKGIVIVAAAGNDKTDSEVGGNLNNKPLYPVCFDSGDKENWILGVSSADYDNHLSSFADYGNCIDIVAPGEEIFSTQYYAPNIGYNFEFRGKWYGTSFSAPLVAGTASLIKSIYPELGPKAITNILLNTAKDLDGVNLEYADMLGYGMLDAGEAIIKATRYALNVKEIYYFSGKKIWSFNYEKTAAKFLTSIDKGEIKSIDAGDVNADGDKEILLFIKRGPSYFVRILSGEGVFKYEFSLPVGGNGKQIEIKEIKFDGERIIARVYDLKNKKSKITMYDGSGRKLIEIANISDLQKWDFGASGLVMAKISKNKLKIESVDWDGDINYEVSLSGVTRVDDMKSGSLWESGGEQIAIIINHNNRVKQAVIDLPSKSWSEEYLENDKKGSAWGLLILESAKGGKAGKLLRFNLKNNKPVDTRIVDSKRNDTIKKLVLPIFGGLAN